MSSQPLFQTFFAIRVISTRLYWNGKGSTRGSLTEAPHYNGLFATKGPASSQVGRGCHVAGTDMERGCLYRRDELEIVELVANFEVVDVFA
jgi:hypothetical protein